MRQTIGKHYNSECRVLEEVGFSGGGFVWNYIYIVRSVARLRIFNSDLVSCGFFCGCLDTNPFSKLLLEITYFYQAKRVSRLLSHLPKYSGRTCTNQKQNMWVHTRKPLYNFAINIFQTTMQNPQTKV